MKIKLIYTLLVLLVFTACADLDLSPLSEGSSENWYSDETEIEMAINDLYREVFWKADDDLWTDDMLNRDATTAITGGTLSGEDVTVSTWWGHIYKAITRANTLLKNLDEITDEVSADNLNKYKANARFNRASQYSILISHWGDVIFSTEIIGLDESFTMSRTDKEVILQQIYEDYDFSATYLPLNYGGSENQQATKGAALAMKARIALYMGDFDIARDAAKACMDLGQYVLAADYGKMFLSSTKNSEEAIFVIPRSVELGVAPTYCKGFATRNPGGYARYSPSYELFSSYLCTDGLPIDESALYDPHNPFVNRDPRCTETIVEFQTRHLGYMYQPHPDSLTCYNFGSGTYVKNNDSRANNQYAAFNGLVYKKGIDEDYTDDWKTDPDRIVMRYADVLLMYAEAKIELNDIDQSVLDAINQVRARAYKVDVEDVASYPSVTATDQAELRTIIRTERRMEFALEGLRYMDILRWKLAEQVLNLPIYGVLDPEEAREKLVNTGLWFFASTPEIDENGIADFSSMYNNGYLKLLALRVFDPEKNYLWPIPSKEILINENLVQNEGY
ncbi:RagB/SusD family nutrient uptake outer membrane protein [uncultured Draconibacterium sp.]|uniref:RagB/SusD family nutrient uptake outer membrane protein n=1 Tax=uncultured Draconibacterium sp. TaxID=1573823 RepID=UPI0025FEDD30|nr:RagB/SusD family nutrient uptake outer membrane protein [uncultured Draconibacterium sp.]